jgi:hypothetical protein
VTGTNILPNSDAAPQFSDADNLLRLSLLALAVGIGLTSIYQFIGSMIWFREYLGDYQVFWGISSVPLVRIYDHRVFAYPPSALLLIRPFGWLPFWPSLLAWSVTGMAAFFFAVRRIMRPSAIALGLATYAGVGVLLGGQISLFIGALLIAGLSVQNSRWRGIFLAAAAVIKPQSVLAAPIALIAERNWRALGWAVAAGCALLLLSLLVFGLDPWLRWVSEMPKFHAYLGARGIDRMDVGVYGLARSFGLPGWTYMFGIPLGITTSWLVFRREAAIVDRYAAFAAATVLMSPYTLYYDLVGLTFACMTMLLDKDRSPLIWLAAALIVSSVLAGMGVTLLAVILSYEAVQRARQQS